MYVSMHHHLVLTLLARSAVQEWSNHNSFSSSTILTPKQTAASFKERLTRVEKILEDRSIDNTMAGAKRRIQEFYEYKTKDKNVLLGEQLSLEGLYNNLAMRLSHNKRPDFIPPAGLTLKDVSAAIGHLEECEQERRGNFFFTFLPSLHSTTTGSPTNTCLIPFAHQLRCMLS